MREAEDKLDELFRAYRAACPEVEPGANFMPELWRRIEARPNFWLVFQRLGSRIATASAALCFLLLLLNLVSSPRVAASAPTYTDALMADHSAERTYYTEAIDSGTEPPSAAHR